MAGAEQLKSQLDAIVTDDRYIDPSTDLGASDVSPFHQETLEAWQAAKEQGGDVPLPVLLRDPDPELAAIIPADAPRLSSGDYVRVFFEDAQESRFFKIEGDGQSHNLVDITDNPNGMRDEARELVNSGERTFLTVDTGESIVVDEELYDVNSRFSDAGLTHHSQTGAPKVYKDNGDQVYVAGFKVENSLNPEQPFDEYFFMHEQDGGFYVVERGVIEALSLQHPQLGGRFEPVIDEALSFEEFKRLPELGIAVPALDDDGYFRAAPVVQGTVEIPVAPDVDIQPPVTPALFDDPAVGGEERVQVQTGIGDVLERRLSPTDNVVLDGEIVEEAQPRQNEYWLNLPEVVKYLRHELGISNVPSLTEIPFEQANAALGRSVPTIVRAIADGTIDPSRVEEVIDYVATFDEGFSEGLRYSDMLRDVAGGGEFDRDVFDDARKQRPFVSLDKEEPAGPFDPVKPRDFEGSLIPQVESNFDFQGLAYDGGDIASLLNTYGVELPSLEVASQNPKQFEQELYGAVANLTYQVVVGVIDPKAQDAIMQELQKYDDPRFGEHQIVPFVEGYFKPGVIGEGDQASLMTDLQEFRANRQDILNNPAGTSVAPAFDLQR